MTDTAIDWSNIGFGYMPTDYNVRCYYRDGKWGDIEVSTSDKIEMHIAATALHYGQEIFEGLPRERWQNPYLSPLGKRTPHPRIGTRHPHG